MKIGRFNLDVEKLKQQTSLDLENFEYRLMQIQPGGFAKKEAEGYLLGNYLVYVPTYDERYKSYNWNKMRFHSSYKSEKEGRIEEERILKQFSSGKEKIQYSKKM